MAFNLSRISQVPAGSVAPQIRNVLEDIGDSFRDENTDLTADEVVESVDPDNGQVEEKKLALEREENVVLWQSLQKLLQTPEYEELASATEAPLMVNNLTEAFSTGNIDALKAQIKQLGIEPQAHQIEMSGNEQMTELDLRNLLNRGLTALRNYQKNQAAAVGAVPGRSSFNLKRVKAQTQQPSPPNEQAKANFVSTYLRPLTLFDGRKGQNDALSEQAKIQIRGMTSPILENDCNDMLERVQATNNQEDAARLLEQVFDNFIAPSSQQGAQVMSEIKQKGIIKYNLSGHVLNNREATVKTAADHFGQEYVLYGPTEKRICPKLSGRGGGKIGGGNVVSEYICRFHCLDGIVIDDNKTICGEALWRAHVADKYSREYVNEDGEIVGGYLNKRFEIDRIVPEENKMRLKPGETRKPRPAAWGSLESRLQDMRNKEGEKRGYGPDTNTGKPFEWCHDPDQNNVQVDQAERERRETAMGHKTVQYTNKSDIENKPKTASAWSATSVLEAAHTMLSSGLSESHVREELKKHAVQNVIEAAIRNAKIRVERESLMQPGPNSKRAFNLSRIKQSQKETPEEKNQRETAPKETRDERIQRRLQGKPAPTESKEERIHRRLNTGFNLSRSKKMAQGGAIAPVVEDGRPIEPEEQKIRQTKKKAQTQPANAGQPPVTQPPVDVNNELGGWTIQDVLELVKMESNGQVQQELSQLDPNMSLESVWNNLSQPTQMAINGIIDSVGPSQAAPVSPVDESGISSFMSSNRKPKTAKKGFNLSRAKKAAQRFDNAADHDYWMGNPANESDSPQSDDLGLSPDYDGRDDFQDEQTPEESPMVAEIVSYVLSFGDRNAIIQNLNQELHNPETSSQMTVHDWDATVDAVNDQLRHMGEPEITPEEFNYTQKTEAPNPGASDSFAESKGMKSKSAGGYDFGKQIVNPEQAPGAATNVLRNKVREEAARAGRFLQNKDNRRRKQPQQPGVNPGVATNPAATTANSKKKK